MNAIVSTMHTHSSYSYHAEEEAEADTIPVQVDTVHMCLAQHDTEGAAHNEGAVMSLLIRYAHIPFYFCFSFTFPTSPIHPYAPLLRRDRARTRTTITLAPSD